MRLCQFTTRQRILEIPITPRELRTDPEVVIKRDDLHARAWECEYEKPIFDSDYKNPVTHNSHEITVRSEEAADEMRSTPGTLRETSPEIIPQTDRSYDGTDTDHYMQPDADTSLEQPDSTPTNPRSSKYDLRFANSKFFLFVPYCKNCLSSRMKAKKIPRKADFSTCIAEIPISTQTKHLVPIKNL